MQGHLSRKIFHLYHTTNRFRRLEGFNSFTVVVLAIPIVLVCSSMASYGFARYSFPGNQAIYYLFLAGLVVPAQLTILPLVLLDKNLGLINTFAGLILSYCGFGMPFAVLLLTGFLRTLPSELRDAAMTSSLL